jgi:RNA polymerase sigma-70 factor (ECF subfamily)
MSIETWGVGREGAVAGAVARAQEGDPDAMEFLYKSHATMVKRCARRIVRDEHAAEDITQSTFAKLFDVIGNYQPREVPFSAWLLKVTRNLAFDHLRSLRPLPAGGVSPAWIDHHAVHERSLSLSESLQALPADQRRVLIMRHLLGLRPRDIAERLGKSEGAVHQLHHRARIACQIALAERGSVPCAAAGQRRLNAA